VPGIHITPGGLAGSKRMTRQTSKQGGDSLLASGLTDARDQRERERRQQTCEPGETPMANRWSLATLAPQHKRANEEVRLEADQQLRYRDVIRIVFRFTDSHASGDRHAASGAPRLAS